TTGPCFLPWRPSSRNVTWTQGPISEAPGSSSRKCHTTSPRACWLSSPVLELAVRSTIRRMFIQAHTIGRHLLDRACRARYALCCMLPDSQIDLRKQTGPELLEGVPQART